MARVHRLVKLFVARVVLDVGRKRRVAHGVQGFVERGARGGETRDTLAAARVGAPVDNFGGKGHVALGVAEVDDSAAARLQALARTNEHFPNGLLVAAERAIGAFGRHIGVGRGAHALAKQEHFGLPARAAFGAQKARRHDARLVGHEHVARLEVFNNVAEDAVFQLARFAIHHEHLARIAHRRRLLGDAALRKIVIEIVSFHSLFHRSNERRNSSTLRGRLAADLSLIRRSRTEVRFASLSGQFTSPIVLSLTLGYSASFPFSQQAASS